MSRLTRRVASHARAASAKTYADYRAHIATLATGGVALWAGTVSVAGVFRTTPTVTVSGSMTGTPWLAGMFGGSATRRMTQHAMPSQAAFDAMNAGGFEFLWEAVSGGTGDAPSLNRNGYTSGGASAVSLLLIPQIIYWDGTQAQRMQPSLGLGPTPYTW